MASLPEPPKYHLQTSPSAATLPPPSAFQSPSGCPKRTATYRDYVTFTNGNTHWIVKKCPWCFNIFTPSYTDLTKNEKVNFHDCPVCDAHFAYDKIAQEYLYKVPDMENKYVPVREFDAAVALIEFLEGVEKDDIIERIRSLKDKIKVKQIIKEKEICSNNNNKKQKV